MPSIEALKEEQQRTDTDIERAALAEDVIEHSRLLMRRDALPGLIREEKCKAIEAEIERLEEEQSRLADEQRAIRGAEAPEVPQGKQMHMSAEQLKATRLGEVTRERSQLGHRIKEKKRELEEIERSGPRAKSEAEA